MVERLGYLALLMALAPLAHADTPPSSVGKKIAGFTLKNTNGKDVALADFAEKKAIVVIFVGTECPINNAYFPHLIELQREYEGKGVQFLAINANRQDSAARVAEHARKFAVNFPVLKDEKNVIADRFGAARTPEAFLLDADRVVRYQGRIDDQHGIGFNRPKPTRRDLGEALDEVLAGKSVSQATVPVAGCRISRVAAAKESGTVTFSRHIAPILQKHCQECHRPGQIGPMSLLDYDAASTWAETTREVIKEERMPPWFADPKHGKFSNDRRLPTEERELLLKWLDSGTPRGDDKDLPPPLKFSEGWRIGEPDLILKMPQEFDVPAKVPPRGVPYKHFTLETNFTEDRWIERAEARPGSPAVVHHILVFIVPPGARFFPGNFATPALCGTAPGDMPLMLKPGFAKKIPAGSRLVFQMHYTPNGTAYKDRSSIGLIFAKKPPEHEVITAPAYNFRFRIPPGADNHEVESTFTFRQDSKLISFMPHMHLRGKDFTYQAVYEDGKKQTLLSVPRYNFNWQSSYRLAEPLAMPKGSKIHCVAHFDNSSKNPNNPDPTSSVFWGDQTWQEMMVGWLDYSVERKKE
jgi:peroxiredoxin